MANEESSDEEVQWDLNKIDWKKAAASLGDNVEIVEDPNHSNAPLLIQKLQGVRNTAVLKSKLAEISESQRNLAFIERLSMTTTKRVNIRDANNDIKREIQFYDATLDAVKTGLSKLDAMNPNLIQRPNDYYAECVKSDHHMARVKQRILFEKKRIGVVEQRKQQQRLRKYHKQIMSEKLKNEKKHSKDMLNAIDQWQQFSAQESKLGSRGLTEQNGENTENTLNNILKTAQFGRNKLDMFENDNKRGKGKKKPNMKRILKNLKYGGKATTNYLARKGKNKHRNTVMSTNTFERDWKAHNENTRRDDKAFARANNNNNNFNRKNKCQKNRGNRFGARISNAQGLSNRFNNGANKFNKRGRDNFKQKKKYGIGGNNKRNFAKRPGKKARLRKVLNQNSRSKK